MIECTEEKDSKHQFIALYMHYTHNSNIIRYSSYFIICVFHVLALITFFVYYRKELK